jgi:hypothetical protein
VFTVFDGGSRVHGRGEPSWNGMNAN